MHPHQQSPTYHIPVPLPMSAPSIEQSYSTRFLRLTHGLYTSAVPIPDLTIQPMYCAHILTGLNCVVCSCDGLGCTNRIEALCIRGKIIGAVIVRDIEVTTQTHTDTYRHTHTHSRSFEQQYLRRIFIGGNC